MANNLPADRVLVIDSKPEGPMFKDLVFAVRLLAKSPGFVVVAVCSLAIGIGANSAIYTLAHVLLLRPLPVLDPNRVVNVHAIRTGPFGGNTALSYPDYADLRDRNRTFEGLVATSYTHLGFQPDRNTQSRMKWSMFVTGNFFDVMGIKPALGRGFRRDEDLVPGRDNVVVISHDLWKGEFGGRPSIVGQKIWLNGIQFTIVGIAPETFHGLDALKAAVFVPLVTVESLWNPSPYRKRDNAWLSVRGRLKPGVGVSQATADLTAISAALRKMYPKTDENLKLKAITEFQSHVEQDPPDTALVVMLGLLALCVLLVACANVAGLLLSRASLRAREIAVKLAVGASRWTLIRQLLVENLVLSLLGAAAGLAVAYGVDAFLNTIPMPTDAPLDINFHLNGNALLFTFFVGIASTFVFGLAPALQTTRLDLITALKEREGTVSKGRKLWGRNLIVGAQVALSVLLLVVSGILFEGFKSEIDKGPGFRTNGLQLMSFDPGLIRYDESQRKVFYKQLLENTQHSPGIVSAALAQCIPMGMDGQDAITALPDGRQLQRGQTAPKILDNVVTPDYFATMRIPILRGRSFSDTDTADSPPVAIVNEQFARHYWPKEDAIGKRLRLGDAPGRVTEVIGVAKLSKYFWIGENANDYIYVPLSQNTQPNLFLIAQSKSVDATTIVPVLRRVIQNLNKDMPVFDVRTMADLYHSRAVATPNVITQLVAGMGAMGLVLAVIGLYGVVSYSVTRRFREFGIRMAVGADRRDVVSMVLRQGAIIGVVGIAAGLIAGVFASIAIKSMVVFSFGSAGFKPFLAIALLLLCATLLGAYIPARRASHIDPLLALREE
ncbi:MAG TPA: ABC transporter permease [Bryobacteraceae bacterium]